MSYEYKDVYKRSRGLTRKEFDEMCCIALQESIRWHKLQIKKHKEELKKIRGGK